MRLLRAVTFYPLYLRDFYRARPELENKSYAEQKSALERDSFGWSDCWPQALHSLGYDAIEITMNAEPLQRAWARETSLADPEAADLREIVLAQIRSFKPDVLWFDDYDEGLLSRILSEVPTIRLVLGAVGSAIPETGIWRRMGIVLSCAPESVDRLRKDGVRATHLHHAFDPHINDRLVHGMKRRDFAFIGQLVRFSQFHLDRERILEALTSQVGIEIFSPSARCSWKDEAMANVFALGYDASRLLKNIGVAEGILERIPLVRSAMKLPSRPLRPVNPKLRPFLRDAVYGLEMFQVLADSSVVLNIHADSSPHFASNMRLFETTGVGTCLVTDWKENLHELFEPDREVVTYRTVEECVEKVRWLVTHPTEREEIARAGQARTLRSHTFDHRAAELVEIIRRELAGNRPHSA